jgi:hypothetical protein
MSSKITTPAERSAAKKKFSVAIVGAQKKADAAKKSAKRAKAGYKPASRAVTPESLPSAAVDITVENPPVPDEMPPVTPLPSNPTV